MTVTFVPSTGAFVHLRFCGDFNSQGLSAVNELLTTAIVNPDFRESGDPTEKGQEGQDFEGWIVGDFCLVCARNDGQEVEERSQTTT